MRLAVKEAADDKLRAIIDEAVRAAVQGMLGGSAEVTESAHQPSPEAPAAAEAGPLHEMEPGAWQAHASRYWAVSVTKVVLDHFPCQGHGASPKPRS
ncbi:hypothetical protein [Streptomyces sp. NPDC057686]|uniref:hypothetical protein n=1 Tax=Streptomyces sp. NPDC057686 TaxID=3346212 RepID=UPI00369228E7